MSSKDETNATGTLYVVATPIGNLEDITLRALRILKEVALVAAEDTRHTRKLFGHFGISTPLISYYKGKEQERAEKILAVLNAGRDVALVSDAGTPGISDPGHIMTKRAREAGIPVVAVPGPSSLSAALSVAGLDEGPFTFLGFLPSQRSQRRKLLANLAGRTETLVFFEAPHRLAASLVDCLETLGDRPAFWARELTKLHEETRSGTLAGFLADMDPGAVKGESVLIVRGAAEAKKPESDDLRELLLWHRDHNRLSLKEAVRRVSSDLGIPRTGVYQEALKIWKEGEVDG